VTATHFVRDCGATTDFVTAVSIWRPTSTYKKRNAQVFVVRGRQGMSLSWEEDKKLVVTCRECNRDDILFQVTAWGDIDIEYRHE